MKTLYFKTEKAFNEHIAFWESIFTIRKGIVQVSCGETNGAYVYDENGNNHSKLVLDEVEYQNAPLIERGE
jgi:hypothetical protein